MNRLVPNATQCWIEMGVDELIVKLPLYLEYLIKPLYIALGVSLWLPCSSVRHLNGFYDSLIESLWEQV